MASSLLTSAARTVSGTSATFNLKDNVRSARFALDVTAAGSQVGDLLDVYLQTSHDGVSFDDFVHFTQVLGNGGAKTFLALWTRDIVATTPMHAPGDATLAAGVAQGPTSPICRIKWVIVNGGGTHSFTFAVSMDAHLK